MILDTLACVISATGIFRPAYADIYETLQAKHQGIYGTDSYIAPDSQDGQMLAVVAKAIDDANAATAAAYNSMSPATAQGAALSNNVKLNGISRAVATHSSVTLALTGNVGATITNGVAKDAVGNRWLLPASVVIGGGGSVSVTATAEQEGAVSASAGTITGIDTPTLGWQTVTNPADASLGAPVEKDAVLRQRQTISVADPSLTVNAGLKGVLLNLPGVTACAVYENDTNAVDSNGLTAHSIAVVIQGGVNTAIADKIMRKKSPGCSTLGTSSLGITDLVGNAVTMRWYQPTQKRVIAGLTIKALSGFVSATQDVLKAALAAYVSGLGIGKKVDYGRLYVPAQLSFAPGSGYDTYEVDLLQIAFFGNALGSADLAIAFNEIANLAVGDIAITVT